MKNVKKWLVKHKQKFIVVIVIILVLALAIGPLAAMFFAG